LLWLDSQCSRRMTRHWAKPSLRIGVCLLGYDKDSTSRVGLNDGVCVPLLFAAIAFVTIDVAPEFDGEVLVDLVEEVAVAVEVGLAVALAVAAAITVSAGRRWIDDHWAQIVPLATTAAAYAITDERGSGFIGAFVAGLVYRHRRGAQRAHESSNLMEEVGGLLSAVMFFVFDASLISDGIVDLDLATVSYPILTVLRIDQAGHITLGREAPWRSPRSPRTQ